MDSLSTFPKYIQNDLKNKTETKKYRGKKDRRKKQRKRKIEDGLPFNRFDRKEKR